MSQDRHQLDAAVADYLSIRRAMGYKVERHERLLGQFVNYLIKVGATTVTIEHAVAWSTLPPRGKGTWWPDRLSIVRTWPTREHAHKAIFDWIEGWYNTRRRHSTLDYLSPTAYEAAAQPTRTVA